MGDNIKKPQIRFKDFPDGWLETELKNIAEFSKGKGYSKKDLVSDGYPIVLYGRLYTNYQTLISEVDTFVKESLTKTIYSQGGEVIIPSSGETAEDIVRATAVLTKGFILGGDLNILYPRIELDSVFLAYNISYSRCRKDLISKAQGKSVVHLNNGDIKEVVVVYPITKEQTQIGNFFKNLDNLIALRQKKYDKLINIKKSMLEKMFPKEGADVPEVRFAGFTGPWERKELGEIMKVTSASRVHKNEWTNSGVPFFRSSDVISEYKGIENRKAFISLKLYEELSQKSGTVQKNDLLVTGGGTIGIPYFVKDNKPIYFKDADLLWFKKSEFTNSKFIYYYYATSLFRRYVSMITHIGTISHYTVEQARSTPIKVPFLKEQNKIAVFFNCLDNQINLSKQELEKLKQIKKSFLEKMFV